MYAVSCGLAWEDRVGTWSAVFPPATLPKMGSVYDISKSQAELS
jgi:hypothetical protein